MTKHELKCWPEYFQAVRSGHKTIELRRDDRPYATGDALHLREYDPMQPGYTGEYEYVRVTHVLRGGEWLAPGYCALSIRLMGEDGRARVQEDFRASYDAEREAHEDAKRALALLKDRFEQEQAKIAGLNLAADQYSESRDAWMLKAKAAEQERDTAQRQLAELTQLIGTESPIAAFTFVQSWHAEKAEMRERLAAADDALAGMVLQYMQFPEGYISHEFMSAQEDAIEYLENIGWLRAGEYERYYWTPESPDGKWQAEKHGREGTTPVSLPNQLEETQVNGQEPPASLLAAARAVCASMSRPLGYTDAVLLVDAALLRVLERTINNQE